jgi:hypothetical protein
MTSLKTTTPRPTKAPNLLIAPVSYSQLYIDQLNNVLRLYFNQVDNFSQLVLIPASGTSANRPTENLQIGQYYFDTTIGLPIYWNGTDWINAIGEPLIYPVGIKTVGRIGTVSVTTV